MKTSTYMQPQKIAIGNGKVYNVSKTRNVEEKASKTAVVLPLESTKIRKNKAPILA